MKHDFYATGDEDAPDVIKDRNGDIVLGLCRRCGQAEADIEPTCPLVTNAMVEAAIQSTVTVELPWRQVVAPEHHDEFYAYMRAALEAALAVDYRKPIYQARAHAGLGWRDVSKERYELIGRLGIRSDRKDPDRRIVYEVQE